MPKKLTQEEFENRVYECVGDKYSVIGEYQGKAKPVLFHCNIHNHDFYTSAECFMRGPKDIRSSCPICAEEAKKERLKEHQTEVECAYCGKKFMKSNSSLLNSRSGLYFCCREHKDLASQIISGDKFEAIRPNHYGETVLNYRLNAFRNYKHECAVCGYNEDEILLEVHHIDSDREHNELSNLIILCPNCHKKLTTRKYQLIDRKEIVKIQ